MVREQQYVFQLDRLDKPQFGVGELWPPIRQGSSGIRGLLVSNRIGESQESRAELRYLRKKIVEREREMHSLHRKIEYWSGDLKKETERTAKVSEMWNDGFDSSFVSSLGGWQD